MTARTGLDQAIGDKYRVDRELGAGEVLFYVMARRGQADSAIALFERAIGTSTAFGGTLYEPGWYAQALVMLGDLYEARGDRAKAAQYYRRHIDVFKNPDPQIAKQVAAVREKLARVTGEPR
jgi:hypothetical protein